MEREKQRDRESLLNFGQGKKRVNESLGFYFILFRNAFSLSDDFLFLICFEFYELFLKHIKHDE